jgi:hypothetical protein
MSRRSFCLIKRTAWLAVALFLASAAIADAAVGQTDPGPTQLAVDSHGSEESFSIWGRAPDRRRFIPSIWAMHPFEPSFPEPEWTEGFGLQFEMIYVGTFINSYGDRALVGGVEREWASDAWGPVEAGFGYRAGVVTGYDEQLFEVARHTPVLPFVGVLAWVEIGPVGADVFYVYRAITLEASVGF